MSFLNMLKYSAKEIKHEARLTQSAQNIKSKQQAKLPVLFTEVKNGRMYKNIGYILRLRHRVNDFT